MPPGAKQYHLYDVKDVLRPRGSMKKESIGLTIKDKLHDAYESWSDPKYGDAIDKIKLLKLIHANLMEETLESFGLFISELCENKDNRKAIEAYLKGDHV